MDEPARQIAKLEAGGQQQVFKWSGLNDFFLFSDETCLAVGGGGHYALYLDSALETGTTGPSETFMNTVSSLHHATYTF